MYLTCIGTWDLWCMCQHIHRGCRGCRLKKTVVLQDWEPIHSNRTALDQIGVSDSISKVKVSQNSHLQAIIRFTTFSLSHATGERVHVDTMHESPSPTSVGSFTLPKETHGHLVKTHVVKPATMQFPKWLYPYYSYNSLGMSTCPWTTLAVPISGFGEWTECSSNH